MLDVKRIRNDIVGVKRAMENRQEKINELDRFIELDEQRRRLIHETEGLKSKRNQVSEEVALKKRNKESADHLVEEMKGVNERIKAYDDELSQLEKQFQEIMLAIPNIPHESVPIGQSEEDNVPIRHWGEAVVLPFAKPHWEIAEGLGILDFERGAKITGSRFVVYKGPGARLERALINLMLDYHAEEHGYTEMLPPFIVNRESMIGTGQLPKFEEDAFKLENNHDYFLVPTAEVPITNLHREEILNPEELPKHYVAYTACFRSEAGSAGKDTRGLIRQHQFNKVELVRFERPEDSYQALEILVRQAEKILQLLRLPYRVLDMCTADLGFTAAKKYDIEVWLPHAQMYREISSCSNFEDFQARRANIRFRRAAKEKPEFVHTLNGSGLAIGRTVATILENYQQEDGSVAIPEVLRPYFKGELITKR